MSISCATAGNRLHVAIVRDGAVFHRTREPNGDWTPWGTINPPEGHEFVEVACACSGDLLHILMRDANDLYFHDIRAGNGEWQGTAQLPDQPLAGG